MGVEVIFAYSRVSLYHTCHPHGARAEKRVSQKFLTEVFLNIGHFGLGALPCLRNNFQSTPQNDSSPHESTQIVF